MRSFKNISEIKDFCDKHNIFYLPTDRRSDLLDRVDKWDLEKLEKKKQPKYLTSYEFGQLNRLSVGDIKYLGRKFKDIKYTKEEWIDVCKKNKVID